MFWSTFLCKSNWNSAWNLAFPILYLSHLLYVICVKIFIMNRYTLYFKELHKEREYYWPTIYRAGPAVVSTITSSAIGYSGTPFNGHQWANKTMVILTSDFFYKKMYGRFGWRPEKVAVITSKPYYRGGRKAGFTLHIMITSLSFQEFKNA